jgi:hypothetical protein
MMCDYDDRRAVAAQEGASLAIVNPIGLVQLHVICV